MRIVLLTALLSALVPLSSLAAPMEGDKIEADESAARILVYYTVGRDEAPDSNVTVEQFTSHLMELTKGDYKVLPLPDIIEAYEAGQSLPPNTVALTFDGGDKSVLETAAPLLEEYNLPYTIFIATARADANDPRYLTWDDIRLMLKSPLISIGLHPDIYGDVSAQKIDSIRLSLNNATARLREETSISTTLFAYPFGAYSQQYKDLVTTYGFKAAFGQQSGVASSTIDRFALPRFTMTEDYADAQRVKMTIDALPLPVTDVTPTISHISNAQPAIGFTVPENTGDLTTLSCFASGQEKPDINIIGKSRVEIRLKQPINNDRFRVNCTLPVKDGNTEETKRWRWFGYLMTLDETNMNSLEN